MPAVYPLSVKSWTPKVDQVDTIWAAHVNDIQNELGAIEKTVGVNPHVWGGWWPPGNTSWPPKVGTMTVKTPPPVSNFGAPKTYTSIGDRIKYMQQQTTWLTLMTSLLAGQSGQKPAPPPAAVIRAPGIKVPTGEGAWTPMRWGAADYDPNKMYHGGSSIYPTQTGFWDVTVNIWADSTVRKANDLHFFHVRLMRGNDEVAGQDSMVETQTWIRHRINLAWQGRWNSGVPMQVQVSQHGAVDKTVDANCSISLSFVRST
ncbi:hypothetical protein ACFVXC_05860 [Streptomyces sp. NPDC058257]|uniref:hypothetical protein n=1 Tax=Streptomyces sp. NPDC058257 TaxID=3346409 RepID=UPI0036E63D0E